jgi:regulator of protease activity HflC (stomatin/prohibitin superfamily)
MFLIIIGFLIIISSLAVPKTQEPIRKLSTGLRILGGVVLFLGIMLSCFVQVDAGHVGVKSLFGNVKNEVMRSGLNFKSPLVDVQELDIRTQTYTMSGVHDEGSRSGDDAIRVLTADGLEVTIDLSVLYRLVPESSPKLIREIGANYEDKIVRPLTRTRIRDNAVYYEAVSLFSNKRDEFQQRIFKTIDDDFRKRGLMLENLLVRNITLPTPVKAAIERKIEAEQEAQKMQFVLQKEKQEAERKRVEAQGISDYQRIISESLTERQLQYEQIKAFKELAGSQNSKIIVMPNKGGNLLLNAQ